MDCNGHLLQKYYPLNPKIITKTIAYMGIGSAIVFVSGYLLQIPTANGYFNLEDAAVLTLAFTLNGSIAAASSIGAGLCDLLLGSVAYVIPSTIIYFIAGLTTSWIIHRFFNKTFLGCILAMLSCEVIIFVGYVTTFCILYGLSDFIGVSLFYIVQIIGNIIISVILYPVAKRIKGVVKS